MTWNPDRPTVETLLAHSDFVRGLARTLVSDPATADDAVQQAWLAAVEHPPADARSPRGWLTTVTRNAVRKTKRGAGRRDAREQAVARPEGSVPSAAAIAEREEARRKLVDAVLGLDEPYRSAIVLRYLEELPPREVAARLAVPVETARTRIKRGLEQLRGVLDTTFAGRTAWGLALIPLAVTGGGTAKAAVGGGLGLGVAAAATLLIGSAVALGFVLSGGPESASALGSEGIGQAPESGDARAGNGATARPPGPDGVSAPDGTTPEEIAKALATPLGGNSPGAGATDGAQDDEDGDAAAAVAPGLLRLRAEVANATVPYKSEVVLTAHFEHAGGGAVTLFTPMYLSLFPFPSWQLEGPDGVRWYPQSRVAQTMMPRGLLGDLREIAPGESWSHTWRATNFVCSIKAKKGTPGYRPSGPLAPGRYRVVATHRQPDNKLPHAGRGFSMRQEMKAVPGVWTGALTANELWIEVQPPTTPELTLVTPSRYAKHGDTGDGVWVTATISNPTREPLPLRGLTLTTHRKGLAGFVAKVSSAAFHAVGGDPLPDPLAVPPGESLSIRFDAALPAYTMARPGKTIQLGLTEIHRGGNMPLTVTWDAGAPELTAEERRALLPPADSTADMIWPANAMLDGLKFSVVSLGGSRVEVRLANDGTEPRFLRKRMSWPSDVRLSIVDAKVGAKTTRSVTGTPSGDFGDLLDQVDPAVLMKGLSWNGDQYQRPGPLSSGDFGTLAPGQTWTAQFDLAEMVYGGVPAGTYQVRVDWRTYTDGRHLALPSRAAVGRLTSEPIDLVVE